MKETANSTSLETEKTILICSSECPDFAERARIVLSSTSNSHAKRYRAFCYRKSMPALTGLGLPTTFPIQHNNDVSEEITMFRTSAKFRDHHDLCR